MATGTQGAVAPSNEEAVEAWDGPLFDVWMKFRHLLVGGLKEHSEEALRVHPPAPGDVALDIGCGLGDTTLRIAELVGSGGSALGLDASPRFIEAAKREIAEAGMANIDFTVTDLQAATFDQTFDYVFSRMGTMFFANPVAALRNVREAMKPGGTFVMVVWRSKQENEWMYRPQLITERFVTKPEDYDQPTCGPGPFSMANADTTAGVMRSAGFEDIELRLCDKPIRIGGDVDEATQLVMSIGPAGEILRLSGERAAHLHEPVGEALREGMSEWAGPKGVIAPASTWIVSGTAPETR